MQEPGCEATGAESPNTTALYKTRGFLIRFLRCIRKGPVYVFSWASPFRQKDSAQTTRPELFEGLGFPTCDQAAHFLLGHGWGAGDIAASSSLRWDSMEPVGVSVQVPKSPPEVAAIRLSARAKALSQLQKSLILTGSLKSESKMAERTNQRARERSQVLKPISGAASLGVKKVSSEEDLRASYVEVINELSKLVVASGALTQDDGTGKGVAGPLLKQEPKESSSSLLS